jgi:hypothetical protein
MVRGPTSKTHNCKIIYVLYYDGGYAFEVFKTKMERNMGIKIAEK